jgi:hypothetical protein
MCLEKVTKAKNNARLAHSEALAAADFYEDNMKTSFSNFGRFPEKGVLDQSTKAVIAEFFLEDARKIAKQLSNKEKCPGP